MNDQQQSKTYEELMLERIEKSPLKKFQNKDAYCTICDAPIMGEADQICTECEFQRVV